MPTIQPQQVIELLNSPPENNRFVIIDLRIGAEKSILGAQVYTNRQVIQLSKDWRKQYQQVLLFCQNGEQSMQLSELLGQPFYSIEGGFDRWQAADMPIADCEVKDCLNRYQHQINLTDFGQLAQQKLAAAHVTVVGAGGLGAPALLYLVAAGIGAITLIDDDQVVLSNLHRQIIYDENDLGLLKVEQAQKKLHQLNSECQIQCHAQRLTASNANQLLSKADLIIDGSDNFPTRYVINDYCLKNQVPWVFAAVGGFELQVAVWCLEQQNLCFQCLYPRQQQAIDNDCLSQGILGTVTGVAAMFQVTEAIKCIIGLELNLRDQMISYNLLTHRFKMLKYPPDLQCPHR